MGGEYSAKRQRSGLKGIWEREGCFLREAKNNANGCDPAEKGETWWGKSKQVTLALIGRTAHPLSRRKLTRGTVSGRMLSGAKDLLKLPT